MATDTGLNTSMPASVVRLAAAAALLALAAVCDASVVTVEDVLGAADWATQEASAGRELLQLVAGNLSNIPQQTVGPVFSTCTSPRFTSIRSLR